MESQGSLEGGSRIRVVGAVRILSRVGGWLAGEGEKRDLKMLALKLQGPQVKERGDPQKLEKAERQTVPSESPKTRQPSLTLTPALQDPRGISDDEYCLCRC